MNYNHFKRSSRIVLSVQRCWFRLHLAFKRHLKHVSLSGQGLDSSRHYAKNFDIRFLPYGIVDSFPLKWIALRL